MKERITIISDELISYDRNGDTIKIDSSNLTVTDMVSLINLS